MSVKMPEHSVPYSSRKAPLHNASRSARPGVLHICANLEADWAGREVVDLSIQTHRAGWKPFIASAGGALVLEAERAAVRHLQVSALQNDSMWAHLRARRRLEGMIQKERPVLLHAHGFEVIAPALAVAARHALPVILDLTEPAAVTPSRRKLLQAAADKGARFRVPSAYMVRHLRQDFQLATDFLYQIAPGIDMQWYDAGRVTPERLARLSHDWRLPEQAVVILAAMPMKPGFGHEALLEAFATLDRSDAYLVMIGNDDGSSGLRGALEKKVSKLGLEGKVVMPEICPDWPAACWLASLVVANNAMPRGQAMELLAGQALGRPVIVTDCGANIEMISPDQTAWVVAAGDKGALTEALREAVTMGADKRIDMAQTTRGFIGDSFPMEFWRDAMFDLYGAMLALPMPTMEAWAA